jgi:ATP-dependent DNA ligase
MRVNEIFETLASDNSRLFKENILKEQEGNSDLKHAIFLALTPMINFYIKKIPEYQQDIMEDEISLSTAMNMLTVLSNREKTGNAGVEHLRSILSHLHPEDAKVIEKIIKRDIRCGVSAKTANKIWDKLVPEYPIMLCEPFNQKYADKFTFPAYAQDKEDGMRFNAIVTDKTVEFRSRNGSEIDLRGNLTKDFLSIKMLKNYVYDGEFLVYENDKPLDRKTGNGILNKAIKGTISEREASMVHAIIWDIIPLKEWEAGKGTEPYLTRWERLNDIYLPNRIHIVPCKLVNDLAAARKFFEECLAKGKEGAVIKDRLGVWEPKRSRSLLKLKNELECDLRITGYNLGSGKYEGLLGSLHCESEDGVIKVNVSGFDDNQRKTLTPENTVGKIMAVRYNERITNKEGGNSLFLPCMIEIREDKTVADMSGDIK